MQMHPNDLKKLKRDAEEIKRQFEALASETEQKEFLMLDTEDRNDMKAQRMAFQFALYLMDRRIARHTPVEEIV